MGCGVIPASRSVKEILRSIAGGRFVGFMINQFMGPPIGLPVRFFGHTAGTVVSLALLTEKRNVPIVPAYGYRGEDGHLKIIFEPALVYPALSDDKDERLLENRFSTTVLSAWFAGIPSNGIGSIADGSHLSVSRGGNRKS